MTANPLSTRIVGVVLTLILLELTAATAYVHFTLGETHFLINAIGYSVLGLAVVVFALPIRFFRPLRWLPRIGLAGFALGTIGAYLVIGPYFTLGWITKGVELAIIGVVVADLIHTYGSPSRLSRVRAAPAERTTGQPA
jgi:hypothetical protein